MTNVVGVGLRQRVIRAGSWSLIGHGVGQAIRLGSNLLMTRLLAPDMFGVMGIAYMVMAGLAMFSDLGIRQSIVQSTRGDEPAFLDTAWALQIVRGAVIGALTLCLGLGIGAAADAGWFASHSVYTDARLPQVLAALALCAVLGGFESTAIAQASRRLTLAKVTLLELYSQLVGLLAMAAWAVFDTSIRALVSGAVGAALGRAVLSHRTLAGHRNRWQWDRAAVAELVSFGKWIFLSSILGFLVNNGDRLILGALVDTQVLGVYTVAFLLYGAVEAALVKLMGDVTYPALSETARDRPERQKLVLYKFHRLLGGLTFVLAGILFAAGPRVVALLYDTRYADAGWMLSILAVGLVMLPYRIGALCLMAMGRPSVLTWLTSLRLLPLYALTPVAFGLWGTPGALWAIVLSAAVGIPVVWHQQWRHGVLDVRGELAIWPLLGAGYVLGWVAVQGLKIIL